MLTTSLYTSVSAAESSYDPVERDIPAEYSLSAIDVDTVTSNLTWQVIDSTQYSKIEIGNYLPAYVWDGSELVTSEQEVIFYPIYGDNQIVAILTMFNPHGEKSYTVGIDFAPELNNAIVNGAKEFFIVEAGSKIFIYSNGHATLLKQYGVPGEVNADELSQQNNIESSDSKEGQGPRPDGQPNMQSGIVTDYDQSNSLTVNELDLYVSSSSKQFDETDAARNNSVSNDYLDITPKNYGLNAMHYLSGIDDFDQGSTESCTFYAATIIGNYLTDSSYHPDDIMDRYGKTKGNIEDAQNVLNDYYEVDYSYIYDIYGRDANMFITRGYPLYAAFYNSALTLGHALAVIGYSDAGDSGIGVMETLGGYKKAIYPSSGKYTTRAYSQNCYWTATLYYKYW